MAMNPVPNETAAKATAMLRRIADMIERSDMAVTNFGMIPEMPMRKLGGLLDPRRLSIDLEFYTVSERCAAFVDELSSKGI